MLYVRTFIIQEVHFIYSRYVKIFCRIQIQLISCHFICKLFHSRDDVLKGFFLIPDKQK